MLRFYKTKKMKWISAVLLIFLITNSCEDSDDSITSTQFNIDGEKYKATETTVYQTDFGRIIAASSSDFDLHFILSDKEGSVFDIVDTLRGTHTGKARVVAEINGDYHFADAGVIEYDPQNQSGTFSLAFGDFELQEGQIKAENTLEEPFLDFRQLSETDHTGYPVTIDTNDWSARTKWELCERSVFNLEAEQTSYSNIDLALFPNPAGSHIQLSKRNAPGTMDLIIVNENLEMEEVIEDIIREDIRLNLEDERFKGNYYRMYYRIKDEGSTLYGSGDLKLTSD